MNKTFSVILFLLFLSTAAWSQSSYLVTHYTSQMYGAGSQNWSIATDNQGFVYTANNMGLIQFDGTHWKRFRIPDQTIIRSVMVDDDQRIYTGSFEDFGYWESDGYGELKYHSLRPMLKNFSFHNDEIWKIVSHQGKVYFQSFSALFVYDHQTVKSIPLPTTIIFLLKASGRLFIQSTDGHLYELINNRLRRLETQNVLAGTEVKAILTWKSGTMLIGTSSKGVFVYDGKEMKPWNVAANESLKKFQINNGILLGDKPVFGTIVKGIFVLNTDGAILHHLHYENALQNNTILSLCSDRNQGIWAGLDEGLDRISFENPLDIYHDPGEQSGAVYTAALDGTTLYLGTNRGVFTYRKNGLSNRFVNTGFLNQSQGQVWELKNIDGTLFCGHNRGTFIIKGKEFRQISDVTGGFAVKKFTSDGEEYLLQSTYSMLVVYKKIAGAWSYFKKVKGFIEPSRFLEIDHNNTVWLGHAVKGIYKLRLSEDLDTLASLSKYGKKDGFPSDFNIRVFKIEDRIVFTTGSILYTYDDLEHKIIPYDILNRQLNGFENATIISKIGENRYCLIRDNDFAIFDISDQHARQIARIYLPLFHLNMVDGYPSVIRLSKEQNLVCLDDGFALFPGKTEVIREERKGKLMFRALTCHNGAGEERLLPLTESVFSLRHAWNTLSVSFTYANTNIPFNTFQYRLDPIDRGWSPWSEKASVTYSRLPKGNYIFQVRTLTSTGEITPPITLSFRIKPLLIASPLAFAGYAIILLAIICFTYAYFRKKLIRKQEQMRKDTETRLLLEKQKAEQEIVKLQNENLQSEISHKNIQLANSTMALIRKNELLIGIKQELEKQKTPGNNGSPGRQNEKLVSQINKNIEDDQDWKIFEELFDQAHGDFFKRLKSAYPELTQSDLKLCAYLKLNLSSKEIAPLLNISYRGVETRRYRLRKRLLLDNDANLVEFILQF